jgi:transposase-like protein
MAKHLTPDERAAIVAAYVESTNACAVAEEFGVGEATVRRCVARAKLAKKDEFHAQACARGLREGRRALTTTAKQLRAWLEEHGDPKAPTLEPGDFARLATALRGVVSGVVECDEHRERKKLSRLSRELKRKEIELAALKIAAGGVERHELAIASPELAAQAAREVFGSPSAMESHEHPTGAASVAIDALPVPDPLDH